MAQKEKRYWKYSFINDEDKAQSVTSEHPYEAVAIAFAKGEMKVRKKSDELINPELNEAVFDNQTGRLCININDKSVWGRPGYKCPDCDGYLSLQKKFFKVGSPSSPWFYLCMNREDKSCKVVVPAKKDGILQFLPTDKATRDARNLTNNMFDRLWKEAPDVIAWSGDPDEMKNVINKAKARGYKYLASAMKAQGELETQIAKMDISTLRIAYKVCKDADLNEVLKFGKI